MTHIISSATLPNCLHLYFNILPAASVYFYPTILQHNNNNNLICKALFELYAQHAFQGAENTKVILIEHEHTHMYLLAYIHRHKGLQTHTLPYTQLVRKGVRVTRVKNTFNLS